MRERNLAWRYIFPLLESMTLNCNFSTGIAFCQRICTPHTNCLLWEGWVQDRWHFAGLCKMQCNTLFLQLLWLLCAKHLFAGGGGSDQGRGQDIWQPADPVNYTVCTTQNCPGLQVCRQMYTLWHCLNMKQITGQSVAHSSHKSPVQTKLSFQLTIHNLQTHLGFHCAIIFQFSFASKGDVKVQTDWKLEFIV